MQVKWPFIQSLHLDPKHELLNARSTLAILELFNALDCNKQGALDDIQFQCLLAHTTDLKSNEILKIFDLLDLDASGSVEFDEFYLLICILTAVKDGQGKSFLFQNWKTVFEVLDADGSGEVSMEEFQTLGLLFNFSNGAIKRIYREFQITGRKELDHGDFQLFVVAAVELQGRLDKRFQLEQESGWRERVADWVENVKEQASTLRSKLFPSKQT